MVKRQTTTRTVGKKILQWISQANCGVTVLISGKPVIIDTIRHGWLISDDGIEIDPTESSVRIHRATVSQIRELINV